MAEATASLAADWETVGRACGAELRFRRRFRVAEASLRHRGLLLSVGVEKHRSTVSVHGLAPWVELRLPTGGAEMEIGDRAFDDETAVLGDALAAFALLDHPTRTRWTALVALGVWAELAKGVLVVRWLDPVTAGRPARLTAVLAAVLAVAAGLAPPPSVEERAADVLATEPLTAVRAGLLEVLLRDHADHAATRRAVRTALTDTDGAIRFRAAVAAGDAGHETLRALAWHDADDASARAVEALGPALGGDELERLLEHACRERKEATAAACLEALARRGDAHVGALTRVLDGEGVGRAVLAARALGVAGAAGAAPSLRAALAHRHAGVRVAAALALAEVGCSPSDVAALHAAAQDFAWDEDLRRAVRAAVGSIRARLGPVPVGQLALAHDGGTLSLSADDAGRVSMEDDGA